MEEAGKVSVDVEAVVDLVYYLDVLGDEEVLPIHDALVRQVNASGQWHIPLTEGYDQEFDRTKNKIHIGSHGRRWCDGQEAETRKDATDDMVGCVACMRKAVERLSQPIYQWTYSKEKISETRSDVPRGDAEDPGDPQATT